MTIASKPPKGSREADAAARAATLTASTIDLPRKSGVDETELTPPPPRSDPYVGTTIDGRYLVERVLGEGGMGVVYAGRHRVIDKRVAIKVLRPDLASDNELNERFLQEARAASAVGNPHIVDISDFGQLPDGSTYFVMELLEGKSLGQVLAHPVTPLPVGRLCHVAKQIAQGLSAAHAANIVHRDLKPDNVMLVQRGTERDFVKILDFGIAKVGSGTKRMTRAGSVFGTPHYMSPEQAAGAAVDHRTDIYALGVILYEMASGNVPFDADNFMGILTQHMYKAPAPMRALVPELDVHPGLDAIVLKCLTKKPEGRYSTMDELLADLDRLERGVLPEAVREMMGRSGGFDIPADYFRTHAAMPALVPATPPEARRRWPLFVMMGGVVVVIGISAAVLVTKSNSGRAPAPAPATAVAPPPIPAPTAATADLPPPPVVVKREILVSVLPGDAAISRDGAPLGQSPVALHLAPGEEATLIVTRKGYKTKTVRVDGNASKVAVTLDPSGAKSGAKPAAPVGIDDVGDPFAKRTAR
jgi:eukaryotic-like serine/threonine-protein kinase